MGTVTERRYRSFTGLPDIHADGNPCSLHILSSLAEQDSLPDSDDSSGTLCYSWPVNSAQDYRVRCYQQAHPVQCCGHGLLAAANYWLEASGKKQVRLRMSESEICAYRQGGLIWLRFPRIPCNSIEIPPWLDGVFPGHQVVEAALAGDDQGYLVLQWRDNFPLASIVPPTRDLANYTRRAIICTAKQNRVPGVTITFRYFAPQYGVIEDQATGSAMRILADYWPGDFKALQVSRDKGYFLASNAEKDFVEIGGYCTEVA